jgi:hypothetical protein
MDGSWGRHGLAAAALTAVLLPVASGWALANPSAKGGSDKPAICVERGFAKWSGVRDRCAPLIEAKLDADFTPERLSKSEQTPISLRTSMRFKTLEGTPLPPLREFEISEDRHARLNLKDVPVCPRGDVESPPPQQRCKDAVIGTGKMSVYLHFPEDPPIEAHSELTAFNSGIHEGVRVLMIAGYLTVPTPAAVIITVLVKRDKSGRYKLKLVGSVPKIAGGSGSVTYLGLRFRKGVFSARCEDRHLDTGLLATFNDGSVFSGGAIRSCVPSP